MKINYKIFVIAVILSIIMPYSNISANDGKGVLLPILLYHNVSSYYHEDAASDNISPKQLEQHFKALKDFGFNPITFYDYYEYRTNGTPLPQNPIILSFDDGYLSNYIWAYPLIKKYGFKATFFTVTDSARNDEKCNFRHFNWEQALEMERSGYIDIESHSFSHKIHNSVTAAEMSDEITKSYSDIVADMNKKPGVYAYPSGKYTEDSQRIAEETGYKMQVIVKGGINTDETPLNELVRLNISGTMSSAALINLIIDYKAKAL